MNKKAEKLNKLADLVDIESLGSITPSNIDSLMLPALEWEYQLYEKSCRMKRLSRVMSNCDRCDGLNVPGVSEVCPPWGNLMSPVVIVGQSAHKYSVASGVPFILQSGCLLDLACRLSEIKRTDLCILNAVACHPAKNRVSKTAWKDNCREWLGRAIEIVSPKLVVALGNDAQFAVSKVWEGKVFNCTHPASYMHVSAGCDTVMNWIVKLSDKIDKAVGD